jgi:hypothetical protein
MSELAAGHVSAIRLSDPMPARCAGCYTSPATIGPGARFVNFNDARIRGGAVVDAGTMAVLDQVDELHLCEACVRSAAEALAFKPELHQRQFREIQRLELARDSYRSGEERALAEAEKLRAQIRQMEAYADMPAPAPRGRPRKAAA